ncbi:MAG: NAD(P)/FAD-dependent oxidoreductase [Chloroflexi bacterium]|nr:NAD(P)/FAD-dependent oxidoreductase [Chloroflexota bacterium]
MDDCLVVGAGPAGSHLAYLLARQGHRVTVLEQQDRVGKGSRCTGVLGAECLERFPAAKEAVVRESPSATFYSPQGQALTVHQRPTPAWVVDRNLLDTALALQAETAGARYLLGTRASDLEVTTDGVTALVQKGGESQLLRAKVVVIANGFASALPQKVGMGKLPDVVMGAQAEVLLAGSAGVEVYLGQDLAPGFFAWLVPTYPGRAWLGLFSRSQPKTYLGRLLQQLWEQGRLASPQAGMSHWGIPLRPRPHTCSLRALVVGDAAGQVKPTTGGGIYYGLLCAELAADTLHQSLVEEDLSAARLKQYEKRWKALIGRELQVGYYARRLYERLSDSQIERLFSALQGNGLHHSLLQAQDFSFDWHASFILRAMGQAALRSPLRALGSLIPLPLRRHLGAEGMDS